MKLKKIFYGLIWSMLETMVFRTSSIYTELFCQRIEEKNV